MPLIAPSELTGPQLDWAVGYFRCMKATNGKPVLSRDLMDKAVKNGMASPSTDWAEGGALMHEARISVFELNGKWFAAPSDELANYRRDLDGETAKIMVFEENVTEGDTPLIAIARCYITAPCFGRDRRVKTIDVPDISELTGNNASTPRV